MEDLRDAKSNAAVAIPGAVQAPFGDDERGDPV